MEQMLTTWKDVKEVCHDGWQVSTVALSIDTVHRRIAFAVNPVVANSVQVALGSCIKR